MKKICCIVTLCVVGVFGATDLPTSAVSIRSMATGYLLKNNTKKAKSVNWEMREVLLPGYLANKYPFGAVQFHDIKDPSKCLANNGSWLQIDKCDMIQAGDYRSLFSILPTTTGAVQILSIANDKCLSINPNTKMINKILEIQTCQTAQKIDMQWLWVIAPAVVESKVIKR
ncbi:cytolethal distending toxin A/C family [Helicobacter fennelliae]|uniref:Cytolethal distending toxin A/C family n=1 Tax=Helicobacter fennelliae MRY12-0050 TaxID=1325130 RepID=T1D0Z7_9HELI|nr:cytolethal distending toxin A/C family [Helicobacter fennelliae]GAD19885.1 cytolethal distending toxin A/C family [Helicobacter fennelliae MRY12-0050]STP08063.1 cytolethal distending toxin CdtC [Helicobacter fennelliae]